MTETYYHNTVDLAWALRLSDENLRGMLRDGTGRKLSGREAWRFLKQAQDDGFTVLPICDNHGPKGHCQGHRIS